MEIKIKAGTFTLANPDKVRRVIEGETTSRGEIVNALGEDAEPEEIIAAYDKIGGLIRGRDGAPVKMGSFYDFKKKTAKEKPEIIYQLRINGQNVELKDGEKPSIEVEAALTLEKAAKKGKK